MSLALPKLLRIRKVQIYLAFHLFFRRSTLASLAFCKNFAIKMAKLLRLGKKKNEFFCFALDFS